MLCQIMSKQTRRWLEKNEDKLANPNVFKVNEDSLKGMNPQKLVEFTWEGKTREEKIHFLSPPRPNKEWTNLFPNKAALAKMHRT